jgi:DNA-binding NtrC family response regulator
MDEETESQLRAALLRSGMCVDAEGIDGQALGQNDGDSRCGVAAMFTTSLAALSAAVEGDRKAPVVVVSRLEEAEQYLLAMELGAHDYCVAPFEPAQLRWMLKTAGMKENRCVQVENV